MLTTFAVLVGLLAPNTAKIIIDSTPTASSVEVDGKKAPLRLGSVTVTAGKHKITVRRTGYSPQTRFITASAGKTMKLSFKLAEVGAKSPAAKKPVAKKPVSKTPVAKTPVSKTPVNKTPVNKTPVTKRPVAKRPVAKKPGVAVGHKPKVAVGNKPSVQPKPRVTAGTRPKTQPRPRTTRPRGTTGVAGGTAPPPAPQRRTSYKPWAVFSFVVGGLAVTGGVLAGMQADDKAKEFNDSNDRREKMDFKDEAEGWALGSNVLYGVGATGIVVGALLWAMDPGDGYAAQIAPLPGGGAYVGVGGTF